MIALMPEIKTRGGGGNGHAWPIIQGDGIYDVEGGKKKSDGEVDGVKVKEETVPHFPVVASNRCGESPLHELWESESCEINKQEMITQVKTNAKAISSSTVFMTGFPPNDPPPPC